MVLLFSNMLQCPCGSQFSLSVAKYQNQSAYKEEAVSRLAVSEDSALGHLTTSLGPVMTLLPTVEVWARSGSRVRRYPIVTFKGTPLYKARHHKGSTVSRQHPGLVTEHARSQPQCSLRSVVLDLFKCAWEIGEFRLVRPFFFLILAFLCFSFCESNIVRLAFPTQFYFLFYLWKCSSFISPLLAITPGKLNTLI